MPKKSMINDIELDIAEVVEKDGEIVVTKAIKAKKGLVQEIDPKVANEKVQEMMEPEEKETPEEKAKRLDEEAQERI